MTLTLSDFLLGRIAQDEVDIEGDWADGNSLHIISVPMHERMERECEAKRRIVEEHPGRYDHHADMPPGTQGWECGTCGTWGEYGVDWPCPTLLALALPYADHPDYRPEWKPTA